jgi:hypothetical protein
MTEEEVDGVLLTDGHSCIFFHPAVPYSDGHGHHHQVDLIAGPFRGSIDASSYESGGLRAFHQQLVALYQSLGPVDIHRSQIIAPIKNNIAANDTTVFS